ncbi:MAG: SsrA-binding protein [uncultured bacterium]|nr:MAG: SsrA-binding protein [uncultured bacterium]
MLLSKNRKAFYNHEITQTFVAGISLRGYEVKAIREGKASFDGAYVQVLKNQPVVVNLHIGRYSKQSQRVGEKDETRTRKLLLNKTEIANLQQELMQKGKTAIPLALVLNHNMIKLELGIAKGRKKAEKKHLEKERQIQKDLQKESKENFRL